MTFATPSCPACGLPPVGTVELIPGLSQLIADPRHPGSFDYAGQTDIDWNDQRTDRDAAGNLTLQCRHGHRWPSAQLD